MVVASKAWEQTAPAHYGRDTTALRTANLGAAAAAHPLPCFLGDFPSMPFASVQVVMSAAGALGFNRGKAGRGVLRNMHWVLLASQFGCGDRLRSLKHLTW